MHQHWAFIAVTFSTLASFFYVSPLNNFHVIRTRQEIVPETLEGSIRNAQLDSEGYYYDSPYDDTEEVELPEQTRQSSWWEATKNYAVEIKDKAVETAGACTEAVKSVSKRVMHGAAVGVNKAARVTVSSLRGIIRTSMKVGRSLKRKLSYMFGKAVNTTVDVGRNIKNKGGEIMNKTKGMGKTIKEQAAKGLEKAKTIGATIKDETLEGVKKVAEKAKTAGSAIKEKVVKGLKKTTEIGSSLKNKTAHESMNILNKTEETAANVKSKVVSGFNTLWSGVKGLASSLKSKLVDGRKAVSEKVKQVGELIGENTKTAAAKVMNVGTAIKSKTMEVASGIKSKVASGLHTLVGDAVNVGSTIKNKTMSGIKTVMNKTSEVGSTIKEKATAGTKKVVEKTKQAGSAIKDKVEQGYEKAKEIGSSLKGKTSEGVHKIKEVGIALKDKTSEEAKVMADKAKQAGSTIKGKASEGLQKAKELGSTLMSKTAEEVKMVTEKTKEFGAKIKGGAEQGLEKAKEFGAAIKENAAAGVRKLNEKTRAIGVSVGTNVKKYYNTALNIVKGWFTSKEKEEPAASPEPTIEEIINKEVEKSTAVPSHDDEDTKVPIETIEPDTEEVKKSDDSKINFLKEKGLDFIERSKQLACKSYQQLKEIAVSVMEKAIIYSKRMFSESIKRYNEVVDSLAKKLASTDVVKEHKEDIDKFLQFMKLPQLSRTYGIPLTIVMYAVFTTVVMFLLIYIVSEIVGFIF